MRFLEKEKSVFCCFVNKDKAFRLTFCLNPLALREKTEKDSITMKGAMKLQRTISIP